MHSRLTRNRSNPIGKMTIKFNSRSQHAFLSNFYVRIFQIQGVQYPSNEHAYQSFKTEDPDAQFRIRVADNPAQAKRWGRQIKIRADWNELVGTPALRAVYQDAKGDILERTKDHYMFMGLTQKFTQLRDLRSKLLETGEEELVENTKNSYWGCGEDGAGVNKLGRMLMVIRARERAQG